MTLSMLLSLAVGTIPLETFPADPVPDQAFFAPHHFLYPLYGVLVIWLLELNDDPDVPAALVLGGAVIALVGWFHFWPFYPVFGTLVSLVGVVGVILGGALERGVDGHWRASIVLLGLIALDDWLDHAFHFDTPLSQIFDLYIAHHMM